MVFPALSVTPPNTPLKGGVSRGWEYLEEVYVPPSASAIVLLGGFGCCCRWLLALPIYGEQA